MDFSKNIKGTYGTMYYVRDMEKSVAYYKEMLNLTPEDQSPGWTTFKLGDHRICLHLAEEAMELNGKGILIANVVEIENMATEAKRRGIELVNEIHEVCENGFSFDIKDPSGNQISFFEYRG